MTEVSRSPISQRVQRLSPSGIRRFFDLIQGMEGVISLGVGEPDFATPWRVREAAIYSLERGHTHYSSNYGLLSLRRQIAAHLAERYGVSYAPENEVLVTVGVSEGVDLAMRALLDPGDEVIVVEPAYVSYVPCIVLAGGVPVPVATSEAAAFCVRPRDIEAKITPRTKAIVLNYPNNPTGAVMTRDELLAIAAVVRRHNLIVISDEVYDRLVYGGHQHTAFSALPGMRDCTVLLSGFSKNYAMTGWRVGYACAPRQIIESMMKVHQYTIMCAPTPSQVAAAEALSQDKGEVEQMVTAYDQRRRLLVQGLNASGLSCFEPQGAFYAFPSVKSTGMSSDQFAELLLKEERVAAVPGSAFGASGEGYLRCCYAVSLQELEQALERIARFVQRHR